MVWNTEEDTNVAVTSSTLEINGAVRELTTGGVLKDVVLDAAREAGYSKFKLFINDEEVLPQDAPLTVESGTRYKIVAFDVAG